MNGYFTAFHSTQQTHKINPDFRFSLFLHSEKLAAMYSSLLNFVLRKEDC